MVKHVYEVVARKIVRRKTGKYNLKGEECSEFYDTTKPYVIKVSSEYDEILSKLKDCKFDVEFYDKQKTTTDLTEIPFDIEVFWYEINEYVLGDSDECHCKTLFATDSCGDGFFVLPKEVK